MKDNDKLVSIIINCYNGSKYLNNSIDSVVSQTYKNWELIIWDNISTDESYNIAKKYSNDNPRIKTFLSSKHTNLYNARNLAISKSSGDIICFLDVDDYWYPFKLAKQVDILNQKNVDLVYSNYDLLYEKNNKITKAFNFELPEGYITNFLFYKYCIGLLTIAFKRKLLDERKEIFDNEYHMIGDFDFILRYSLNNKIFVINDSTGVYRIHSKNESFLKRSLRSNELLNWYKKNNKLFSNYTNFQNIYFDAIYSLAIDKLIKADRYAAIKLLFKLRFRLRYFKLYIAMLIPSFILKILL